MVPRGHRVLPPHAVVARQRLDCGSETAGQVDYAWWSSGAQRCNDRRVRGRDNGSLRSIEGFGWAIDQESVQVWGLCLDISAVGPDQVRGVDDGIMDSELVALADQRLGQADARAFA